MKYVDVIKHYGTQVNAAEQLGLSQPTVSNWKRRGGVPALQQLRIQERTGGKLKADSRIMAGK